MLWRVPLDLKQIFAQGRGYPWPRPDCCLRCQNWCVWGHGYVRRYFDGFVGALLMKCYRCPSCGCVITLRPISHFPRIRCPQETIQSHLRHRLNLHRWPPSALARSRLRHWLANLRCQVQAYLTNCWSSGLWAGFGRLLLLGRTPVARVS